MHKYIGAVIAERNILSPLRLFVIKKPINYAGTSGKRNRFFTQKLHVQMANSHWPPQSQTNTQPLPSFWPTSFSLLSTFKKSKKHIVLKRNKGTLTSYPLPLSCGKEIQSLDLWYLDKSKICKNSTTVKSQLRKVLAFQQIDCLWIPPQVWCAMGRSQGAGGGAQGHLAPWLEPASPICHKKAY